MATPIWIENEKRWKLRIMVDGVKKNFTSTKQGIAGKKEVLRKARQFQQEGSQAKFNASVNDAWKLFIDSVIKEKGSDSESVKLYNTLGKLYVLPAIGNKKIARVTKQELQNIISDAKPHNGRTQLLSKKYLNNLRLTITVFWKWAYENNYCDALRGSLFLPVGHPTKEREILQPDEIRRLFEPSDEWYWRALCFMLLTGLRPSELLGLQWSDIKSDHFEINRGITTTGKISDGKTENARREIPLSSMTIKILKEQKLMTSKLKSEWVFCSKSGEVGSQSTLTNCYSRLKKERNLSGSLYSFRHTFISLVKMSLPEVTIKEIVGHSTSMDTFGTYGHIVDGQHQQTAELLNLAFEKISQ